MSPLRAYIVQEGLTRFATNKYKRGSNKKDEYLTNTSNGKKSVALKLLTWSFKRLRAWLDGHGLSAADVFAKIYDAVVSVLMVSEPSFHSFAEGVHISGTPNSTAGRTRTRGHAPPGWCPGCYQLLGFDVILDSRCNPVVLEVNGLPSMQLGDDTNAAINYSSHYAKTKVDLTRDIVRMIYKPTSVAADLFHRLSKLRLGVAPGPACNARLHNDCMERRLLPPVIRMLREEANLGAFHRVYPSAEAGKYAKLAKLTHDLIVSARPTTEPRIASLTTWTTHRLATSIIRAGKS